MHRINSWLSIGRWRDTCNLQLLRVSAIEAMLQLAAPVAHPHIPHLFLPIIDGQPIPPVYLDQASAFIRHHFAAKQHILIACGAGISRSAAFGILALRECLNLSLIESYRVLITQHPDAAPHPALVQSLCDHYPDDMRFSELWQAIHKMMCNPWLPSAYNYAEDNEE